LSSEGGATAALCEALLEFREEMLPPEIQHEASRTLFNVIGVAVGGSRHEAVDILIGVAPRPSGGGVVPGRSERLDPYFGAFATGLAAHLDDFDDTHLETVVHPGSVALATLLALGPDAGISGPAALTAFALACEVQLRVAAAMTPWNFDAGWQVTGTAGVIGAAAGAGIILGLDAAALAAALGIAGSETVGLREAHGTMIKAAHPGKAAANGVLAALLARRGFSGPPLERTRGYFDVLSGKWRPERLSRDLGERWELASNTYKPYPGGIVSHPAIDAAVALASVVGDPGAVEEVVVHCHPLVLELTADPQPSDPLHARFSTPHAVAVGLLDGEVGIAQLAADRLTDHVVAELRNRVQLLPEPGYERDEAKVEVRLAGGTVAVRHIDHARGGLARPLSDEELAAKVERLVEPVLSGRSTALREAVAGLVKAPSLDGVVDAVTPPAAGRSRV
jgi:2-methylcitrate dehydratase PrpD